MNKLLAALLLASCAPPLFANEPIPIPAKCKQPSFTHNMTKPTEAVARTYRGTGGAGEVAADVAEGTGKALSALGRRGERCGELACAAFEADKTVNLMSANARCMSMGPDRFAAEIAPKIKSATSGK